MSESSTFRMQPRKSYLCLFLLTICVFLTQGLLAAATDTPYGENELHKDNGGLTHVGQGPHTVLQYGFYF